MLVVEQAHSARQAGAEKMGFMLGRLYEAAETRGLVPTSVHPHRWHTGVPGLAVWERKAKRRWPCRGTKKAKAKAALKRYGERKVWLHEAARRLAPSLPLARAKDQGLADAFFIACWAASTTFGYTYRA